MSAKEDANRDVVSGLIPRQLLGTRHQMAAGAIVGVCVLALAGSLFLKMQQRQRSVDIERPFVAPDVQLLIDINLAAWPELTLLPEVSETMARRIVAHRKLHGDFQSVEEVMNVRGIGPRTFELVEPFLFAVSPGSSPVEPGD